MKLFPEAKWKRLFVLVLSTALLTFIATSFLFVSLAIYQPRVIWRLDYFYRFSYLNLTKKLIWQKKLDNGCRVYLYSERLNWKGQTLAAVNLEELDQIATKAMRDFPRFMSQHHRLAIPPRDILSLSLTLVREKNLLSHYKLYGTPISGLTTKWLSTKIYLRHDGDGLIFDIAAHRLTIRHELFHWLEFEHGLEVLIPEQDAWDFSYEK